MNPFDESSGHAVLQGFESNVCVRERDMSCILTFCDGLSEFNDSHPDDYQVCLTHEKLKLNFKFVNSGCCKPSIP